MYTLGIIGNGFVGKATALFKCDKIKVLMYDIDPEKCEPKGLTLNELVSESDFVMVCVPTPMKSTGECDTSIVESCIHNIRKCESYDLNRVHIVIRSTVPVGFCKRMQVNHMPEFLTEANWEKDFKTCELWVAGTYNADDNTFFVKLAAMLLCAREHGVIGSNTASIVPTDESEFIKLGRNCFLAAKLSICNEYYSFCQSKGINYNNAMYLIGCDKRIGTRYTSVPGPDGKTGWSGTCFPKDTASFVHQLHESNTPSYMIEAAVKRNSEVDRPDHDWKDEKNKGRTFV
jgi:UDPglucose 6-dehydrogenase